MAGYFNLLADIGCGEAFTQKILPFIGDADYGALDANPDYLQEVKRQYLEAFPGQKDKVHLRQSDFLTDPIHFPGVPFPVMLGATITNFGTIDSVRQIFRQIKPLAEQGNGSFIFTHDTNTHVPTLDETYLHEYLARSTLNVLHRMKRDLISENFNPDAFGFTRVWDKNTSTYNLCMYPKKGMTFMLDGEWFTLKKDQILPQAPLMKLPSDLMLSIAKSEGFDHHNPIFDRNEGHIALQHVHL